MARIVAMITLSLSETKDRLSAVIDDVETRQEMVAITKNGRPAAYLISPEQMVELEDTAFWLSFPGLQDSLATSRDDILAGRTLATAEVRQWVNEGMPGAV